ncbi:MAG: hypothetical protein M5U28_43460 [Sandaracinaceae bacterium]|nr:hypothetical protein [Sandaracinaceae bacterium]
MSALRVDRTCWPVLLNVFNGEQEDTEFDAYIREMDAIYAGEEAFIAASFMLRYRPDMAQLRRLAEFTHSRRDAVKRTCLGTAIIAPSAGFRFLFSTLLMMMPLPIPYCVVSDVDEACAWIEQELREHRLTPPRRLREYLHEQMRGERAKT